MACSVKRRKAKVVRAAPQEPVAMARRFGVDEATRAALRHLGTMRNALERIAAGSPDPQTTAREALAALDGLPGFQLGDVKVEERIKSYGLYHCGTRKWLPGEWPTEKEALAAKQTRAGIKKDVVSDVFRMLVVPVPRDASDGQLQKIRERIYGRT